MGVHPSINLNLSMTRILSLAMLSLLLLSTSACAQNAADTHAINEAVSAAPDDMKEGAKVLGYNENGTFRTIREGTNDLVCTADDPARDGFETACFQADLEAYITRGRELRADGMNGQETVALRGEEIASGALSFTDGVATQYIRFGEDAYYDEATGEVINSNLRYVIYSPYSTAASTGLSTQPMGPGAPWIMASGTWRAHIMIIPSAGN